MNNLVKKSFTLAGHQTSIALEPEFWEVLEALAKSRSVSLPSMIGEIDSSRGNRPLASSLRVYCLKSR